MNFSLTPCAFSMSTWVTRKRSPVVSLPLVCGPMSRCSTPLLNVARTGISSSQTKEKSYSTAVKKVWRALKMVILEPKILIPTQK